MRKHLPSMETFIQFADFYLVRGLLSSLEFFIQGGDFYLVRNLLSIVDTFFPLTNSEKWRIMQIQFKISRIIIATRFLHTYIFLPTYVFVVLKKSLLD